MRTLNTSTHSLQEPKEEVVSIEYVNYMGESIDVSAAKLRSKTDSPKKQKKSHNEFHKGYKVVGINPDDLKSAREIYEKTNKCRWSDELVGSWVRRHKKLIKKASIIAGSVAAKELAEKLGYLHVEIRAIERKG